MATRPKMDEDLSKTMSGSQLDDGSKIQTEDAAGSVSDLKGSLEQQQAMIGQLREALRSKSSSQDQDNNAEDYATRLAKMKPRLIRGRGRAQRDKELLLKKSKEKVDESLPEVEPAIETPVELEDSQESNSTPDRQDSDAFEEILKVPMTAEASEVKVLPSAVPSPDVKKSMSSASSESQGESSTRTKLLLLRKQREENRIKFERQLRENADKKGMMDEMKDRIEKLRQEVEERDHLIESFNDNVTTSHPNMQHLYQQILYKDNTILDLTEKLNQLEVIIQDQKEQISEKEQIIAARTEAVSLVTKDRDDKLFHSLEELDKERQYMRNLREETLSLQNEWKEKEKSLESVIDGKNKRISTLEENFRRIENVRFGLTTHNAELQEKLVLFQSEGEVVRTQLTEAKEKLSEQVELISELEKKVVRAESFGQKKLKAFEKQLRSLEKDSTLEQSLIELQNQIAELEEEKGNLQLKLVDFDDFKGSNAKLRETNLSLEKKLEGSVKEMNDSLSTISALENEKVKLIDALNAKDLSIINLEEEVSKLREDTEKLTQTKVTLELRLCAVEEERDKALSCEVSEEKGFSQASESSERVEEFNSLKSQLNEVSSKYEDSLKVLNETKTLLNNTNSEFTQKAEEYSYLINLLAEKEATITTQSISIENHDATVAQMEEELVSRKQKLERQSQSLIALQEECAEVSVKLDESDAVVSSWEEKVNHLQTELRAQKETILKLRTHEEKIAKVISEKNNLVQNLEGEVFSLKEILEQKENSMSIQMEKMEKLDNLLSVREDEVDKLKNDLKESLSKGEHLESYNKKLEDDLSNIQTMLKATISNLETELEAASCIISDKENKIETLLGKLKQKDEGINNNQIMISKFESDLCEKNKLYDILLDERAKEEVDKIELRSQIASLESEITTTKKDLDGLQAILMEREFSLEQIKDELSAVSERHDVNEDRLRSFERCNNSLTQENQEIKSTIKDKEERISSLEIEISSIHSSQKNESSNLASALIEKEMEIQKLQNSILSASSDVSAKSDLIAEWESELMEKCQKLSEAEEKIIAKDQEIQSLTQNMQSINEILLNHESEYVKMKEDFVEQINENQKSLNEMRNKEVDLHHLLETNEKTRQQLEQNVNILNAQLEEKFNYILALEERVRSTEEQNSILSSSDSRVKELQASTNVLNENLALLQNKNQELESQILEYKQYIDNLASSESSEVQSKIHENESLRQHLSNNESTIKSLEEKLLMLEMAAPPSSSSEEDTIALLKKQLLDAENELEVIKTNFSNASSELQLLRENQQKLEGQSLPSISDISQDNSPSQIQQLQNELSSSKNEQTVLKQQLEGAQQAIIHLETSLATQSLPKETKDNSWDEWGDVDLGQPSITEPSLSIQSSLIEKDKALTVIQEQLKDALEQVNTVTDEKKLLEHQMKTLEAELSHKDQKISSLKSEIEILDVEKTNLSIAAQQLDSQKEMYEAAQNKISNFESAIFDYQAKVTHLEAQIESLNSNVALPSQPEAEVAPSDSQETPSRTESPQTSSLDPSEKPVDGDQQPNPDGDLEELKYKLSWYEGQWATWSDHYNQMQVNHQNAEQQIALLNNQVELLNAAKEESLAASLEETSTHISELENEINRLRHFETQNSQLQSQIQTLEYQSSASEKSLNELQSECKRLQGIEVLYGEMQTSMLEAETKREGSKSRIQELELMVQSAESEISRLRLDLQTLTSVGKSLETERSSMSEEISNLKEEIRKINNERERVNQENTNLQTQAGTIHSQLLEHQELISRMNSEANQLRSELEVMEGENERFRINYEILEGEIGRMRNEMELLNHNSCLITAEKESLETEVQRLNLSINSMVSESNHFRGEIQRHVELSTSAESEISRLKGELKNAQMLQSRCHELELKNGELDQRVSQLEEEATSQTLLPEQHQNLLMEEVDWSEEGKMEDEHLQGSGSANAALQDEIASLKEEVISLEKEKNHLGDELQSSKVKNGKMIQKLKAANNKYDNLKKEFDKIKQKAGGFSDLDQALEEEWKSQVTKVESERDEFKVKLDELESEKQELVKRLDVLETAQEKYFELKESQDSSLIKLSERNKELEGHVGALEWKISEYEERGMDSMPHTAPAVSDDGEVLRLNQKINELQASISTLNSEKGHLKQSSIELESRVESLIKDNEHFQSLLENMKEAKKKAETDSNTYKTTYLELYNEHETQKNRVSELEEEFSQLSQEHTVFKSAYDSLYNDYSEADISRDSLRCKLRVLSGEKTKLTDEVQNLNNRLEILMEQEETEIIRSLQDECASQQQINSELKDEIIQLQEDLKVSQEKQAKIKNNLDQQVEFQDLLRFELNTRNKDVDFLNNSVENNERQLKYITAESNSLKAKSNQQQVALEESNTELKKMSGKLKQMSEENLQLIEQVRSMEASLRGQLPTSSTGEESGSPLPEEGSSDLNSALSSLHLRNLRCQQMSLEINQLLEERDSLQLKLSAALRQNQELSRELTLSQQMPVPTSPPSLNQKLEELRELNLSMERKGIDKLSLSTSSFQAMHPSLPTFTSHTAPPTPTASRQAADYAAARQDQGASSTLFGWILGKSPQKAVLHI